MADTVKVLPEGWERACIADPVDWLPQAIELAEARREGRVEETWRWVRLEGGDLALVASSRITDSPSDTPTPSRSA